MSLKDWFKLILLSLIWGGSFLFVEIALTAAGPLTLVMYRVGLGALALWLFCLWHGEKVTWTFPLVIGFLVMGVLNNVLPFTLIAYGQTEVTAGLASILNATTPLFAVAVGHFWPDGERATPLKVAGVIVGIIGIAVLVGPAALSAGDSLLGPGVGRSVAHGLRERDLVEPEWGMRFPRVRRLGCPTALGLRVQSKVSAAQRDAEERGGDEGGVLQALGLPGDHRTVTVIESVRLKLSRLCCAWMVAGSASNSPSETTLATYCMYRLPGRS